MTDPVELPNGVMEQEERELLIVEMRRRGYSYYNIGRAVGYGVRSVKNILAKHGYHDSNRVDDSEIAIYVRLYRAGMSIENIARRYRRAYSTVRAHLIQAGAKMRGNGLHVDTNSECGGRNAELSACADVQNDGSAE